MIMSDVSDNLWLWLLSDKSKCAAHAQRVQRCSPRSSLPLSAQRQAMAQDGKSDQEGEAAPPQRATEAAVREAEPRRGADVGVAPVASRAP